MLGWQLLDAGEPEAARLRFQSAVDDPVPNVRASAAAGLEELRQRSESP